MESKETRDQLVGQVIDIIFNSLNLRHIQRSQVNENTPLINGGLSLDSVDILEMVVNLEQKFNFKLKPDEAGPNHFESVRTIVDLIESKALQH